MLNKTITKVCIFTVLMSASAFGALQETQHTLSLSEVTGGTREPVTQLSAWQAHVGVRDERSAIPFHGPTIEDITHSFIQDHGGSPIAVMHSLIKDRSAFITEKDQDGLIPLHKAIASGNTELIALLTTPATVNIADNEGETALHKAVLRGANFEVLQLLIATGANVNAQDKYGWTPLHLAVFEGKRKIVRFLLVISGVNIDSKTTHVVTKASIPWWGGTTALHIAACRGFIEIAGTLLYAGCKSCARDMWKKTPLITAAEYGHATIVQLLLMEMFKVKIEDKDAWGYTALHMAIWRGHIDVSRMLIQEGANATTVDNSSNMPLHTAALYGHYDLVKLLLKEGVDPNLCNISKRTPLCLAQENGYERVAELLRNKGARDRECRCRDCKERYEGKGRERKVREKKERKGE